MSVKPLSLFRVEELVLSFSLVDGDDEHVELRASLGSEGFTAPQRVTLGEWESARDLGERLFSGEVGTCLKNRIEDARREGHWLRIVLEFPQSGHHPTASWLRMVGTPWEQAEVCLFDREGTIPLALSEEPKISMVRSIAEVGRSVAVVHDSRSAQSDPKPRYRHIDVTAGGPPGLERLEATEAPLDRNRCEVDHQTEATYEALRMRLNTKSDDLTALHITGHGEHGGIPLRDATVRPVDLKEWLAGSGVRLLLLSVCDSASPGETTDGNPGGLISLIPEMGISAFIGMQKPMQSFANRRFVESLFRSLEYGESIDEAMWKSRAAVLKVGSRTEPWWYVPVLYLNKDLRTNPWLWPTPDDGRREDEHGAGSAPQKLTRTAPAEATACDRAHPALPAANLTFAVNTGSCFIEFPHGLTEVYPQARGLGARRLPNGTEEIWNSSRYLTSVAMDATGRIIACALDGEFCFAQVGPRKVLGPWVTAQNLSGEVTAVHSVLGRKNGGVEAMVTLGGALTRIRADRGGYCGDPAQVRGITADGQGELTDNAHDTVVTLRGDGPFRSIVLEYQGETKVFEAPNGATGVNIVRQRGGPRHAPDLIVRMGSTAGLWNVSTLWPVPALP